MSSATTFPPRTVKAPTENATPSRVVTAPATPLTSAGCVNRPSWAKTNRPTGHLGRTTHGTGGRVRSVRAAYGTGRDGALVGADYDIGVEDGEERLEVAVTRRSHEGVDHLPLALHVDVGDGRAPPECAGGPGWPADGPPRDCAR